MDTARLARYPFLPEARAYIREKGVSLEELIAVPPEENYALQDAWNRVLGALAGRISFVPRVNEELWRMVEKAYAGEDLNPADVRDAYARVSGAYSGSYDLDVPSSEQDLLNRILSYPLARIMVSCTGDRRFMRRYALKEAELFRALLERDFEEKRDVELLVHLGRELGLNIDVHENWAAMDVISYVKNTAQMKDRRKSLLFQDVRRGMVYFTRKEGESEKEYMSVIFRSFQQALQKRLDEELPLEVPDETCRELYIPISLLEFAINESYEKYSFGDLGAVEVEKFPPCMRHLLGMAREGINLPHSGRFALTAFLHLVGMSVDEIVAVFSASPDFNESITRYQVKHIAGEISGTEYTPQKCSVMISEGLCRNPDELCKKPWMNHPLTYYRVKKEGEKRKGKKGRSGARKEKKKRSGKAVKGRRPNSLK